MLASGFAIKKIGNTSYNIWKLQVYTLWFAGNLTVANAPETNAPNQMHQVYD